jgi:general secretion pathway protein E
MRADDLSAALKKYDPADQRYATEVVERVLAGARQSGASDVHFQPAAGGLDLSWRIDGVLQAVTSIPAKVSPNIVARLKVLAELLTYRTDVPQEGRIRGAPGEVEMRVSTFPTLFGEKAVVRLFAAPGMFLRIEELGLPAEVRDGLGRFLGETSGAIVLSGPAGS